MTATARPRGRRPAGADTRGEILAAARAELAARGYEAASVRAVARRAGVDPALVRHYFDDRADLFAACLVPDGVDPDVYVPAMVAGGLDGLGERVVRGVVGLWDAADGQRFRATFAALTSSEPQLRALTRFFVRQVLLRVAESLDEHGPVRMSLVFGQLLGALLARHVMRIEPFASATPEQLGVLLGPAVQACLTGPLPADALAGVVPLAANDVVTGAALAPDDATEQNSPHDE
jgi:AcrR family transcriptional regulator